MPIIAARGAGSAVGYGFTGSRPTIVSTGLGLHLNAANPASYPGSGTTWYDLSGNGLHATGGSALSSQRLSWNQPYNTASTSLLNTDTHSIFFSIQINGTTGTWDKIFGYTPSGTDRSPGIWRYPNERTIHWRYDPSNTGSDFGPTTASDQFPINTWYYVGVTKNGATAKTYVNGVNTTTQTVSSPKTAGNSTIQLYPGYSGSTSYIRHVHIYNRVLTDAEVLNNYNVVKGELV